MILPTQPFGTIALSLSGGGYRAAAFHLGAMAYLNRISYAGTPLLHKVKILSSVSGGSFTSAMYATTIRKGGDFRDVYTKLYRLMKEVDLVDESLKKLGDKKCQTGKTKNLINAFAEVYHEKFFPDRFDLFWNGRESHLSEIIFNTTEFSRGLAFRFQKTHQDHGYFGNYFFQTPLTAAREIRIADVVAASSCFPGGFEPMVFPADFQNDESPLLDEYAKELESSEAEGYPISIMDGGIVDNQGIGSVILAERRMCHSQKPDQKADRAIDLFIVSDVAAPDMDALENSQPGNMNGWRSWSFRTFEIGGIVLSLISLASLAGLFFFGEKAWLILFAVMGTLTGLAGIVSTFLGNLVTGNVPSWFKIPPFFVKHLGFFHRIRFGVYRNMIVTRKDSVMKMISEVFMKQIRRLSYKRLYENPNWKNRVFMNAVHELRQEEITQRNRSNPADHAPCDIHHPGPHIARISEIAASMGTTLWFTPDELRGKENKLDALLACGNYTMCYNLWDYIDRLRRDEDYKDFYTDDVKAKIEALHGQLLEDWKQFKEDPFWMQSGL